MEHEEENCVSHTDQKSQRVFVEIWALETLLQRRRLVLEVPSNCSVEEIERIGGIIFDDWANAEGVDSWYETEDHEDFEVLDQISVEAGVPDHLDSDLVLVRGGDLLVLKED